VDLVIALPISWLPLVSDYNRFARRTTGAFWGTFVGFAITNFWFLALGAMALLGAGLNQTPKDFAQAIALAAGWIALLILLADETHNAWADLYSSAVSLQNAFPRVKQRWLIVGLGLLAYVVAVTLDITEYQNFLYLVGSFFIPLFGILVADYFVVQRRKYAVGEFYRQPGRYWFSGGVNIWGIVAWGIGIAAYHITNPTTLGAFLPAWPQIVPAELTRLGGSLPSFVIAMVTYSAVGLLWVRQVGIDRR
jgi:nucleobase:cation symporter-1, NCS1 family